MIFELSEVFLGFEGGDAAGSYCFFGFLLEEEEEEEGEKEGKEEE